MISSSKVARFYFAGDVLGSSVSQYPENVAQVVEPKPSNDPAQRLGYGPLLPCLQLRTWIKLKKGVLSGTKTAALIVP